MKWQPWEDFKINPDLSDRITKPPCSKCQFWHPQINEFTRLPNGMIIFDGVTCCLSDVMHHDFSCFRAKGTEMGIIADIHAVLCGDDVPSGGPTNRQMLETARLYSELLYAVERKFPGESRHQTALRYIREAERGGVAEQQEARKES